MTQIRKTISEQVRKYRKARGFSQARLAEVASISEDSVWAIERQKSTPSVETLEQLSQALNVRLPDLLLPDDEIVESEADQELERLKAFLKVRDIEDIRMVQDIVQRIFKRIEG